MPERLGRQIEQALGVKAFTPPQSTTPRRGRRFRPVDPLEWLIWGKSGMTGSERVRGQVMGRGSRVMSPVPSRLTTRDPRPMTRDLPAHWRSTPKYPMTVQAEREIDTWLERLPQATGPQRVGLQNTLLNVYRETGRVPRMEPGTEILTADTRYTVGPGRPEGRVGDFFDRVNQRIDYLRARSDWQHGRGPMPAGATEEWRRRR